MMVQNTIKYFKMSNMMVNFYTSHESVGAVFYEP